MDVYNKNKPMKEVSLESTLDGLSRKIEQLFIEKEHKKEDQCYNLTEEYHSLKESYISKLTSFIYEGKQANKIPADVVRSEQLAKIIYEGGETAERKTDYNGLILKGTFYNECVEKLSDEGLKTAVLDSINYLLENKKLETVEIEIKNKVMVKEKGIEKEIEEHACYRNFILLPLTIRGSK